MLLLLCLFSFLLRGYFLPLVICLSPGMYLQNIHFIEKKMYGNFLIRKLTSPCLKRIVAVGSKCSRDQSTRTSCGIRIRLDRTFILWRNQLQNRKFPVINELLLVDGRGHAKNTAFSATESRKKRTKVWRVHSSAKAKQPHSQPVAMQKF